jgi:hypothetical protein
MSYSLASMLLGVYPILVSQIVQAPSQRVANLTLRRWRSIGPPRCIGAPPALLGDAQFSGDKGIYQRELALLNAAASQGI